MSDLIVLTADRNALFALRALVSRNDLFHLPSTVEIEFLTHPGHDPGVLRGAVEFLRPYLNSHRFALVTLDCEGCGQTRTAKEIETHLEEQLARNGWHDRAAAIVFEPELERWIWNRSKTLSSFFNYENFSQVKEKLNQNGFIFDQFEKPVRPKEAFEYMMATARRQRSSSVYKKLALSLAAQHCTERGYVKLCSLLHAWFEANEIPKRV